MRKLAEELPESLRGTALLLIYYYIIIHVIILSDVSVALIHRKKNMLFHNGNCFSLFCLIIVIILV